MCRIPFFAPFLALLDTAYDAAGNLTFDGTKAYAYDAYNRLVSVRYAYHDGSSVVEGMTLTQYQYDAQGRRIRKNAYLGGTLDTVERFYYHGWSVIETRDNFAERKNRDCPLFFFYGQ